MAQRGSVDQSDDEDEFCTMFAMYEAALHQRRVQQLCVLEEIDAAEEEREAGQLSLLLCDLTPITSSDGRHVHDASGAWYATPDGTVVSVRSWSAPAGAASRKDHDAAARAAAEQHRSPVENSLAPRDTNDEETAANAALSIWQNLKQQFISKE
ncbi:hypothetical protein HPB50_010801 [Hyalomma asiaticum]|uniref:Uncharacterized protein n=1 Tax=Hyalomma asiaticum TaxID=266040 RepID=A0ACB7SPY0_HYAAI|nr:hypothetical protein HPB50_010801 [Hyalomma asiaticum]